LAIFDNGVVRTLGAGLIFAGGLLLGALKWLFKGINALLIPIANGFQAIGIVLERGVGAILEAFKTRNFSQAMNNFWANVAGDLAGLEQRNKNRFRFGGALPDAGAPPDQAPKPRPVPKSVVNIGKVEINQKVEQNANPDRVAWAWGDMLKRINTYPRESRVSPLPLGS
jgi:hypothetical protein